MQTDALNRATDTLAESDLQHMVLEVQDLPSELSGFQVVRETVLDNEMMAEQGFPNATSERYQDAGRISGYVREFRPNTPGGFDVLVGTVAHLFRDTESVSVWMHDIFLKDFEDHVGEELGTGHELISVQRLNPVGFFDEAVALKAVQNSPTGLLSSTVIDFRVGRILGVAFIGSVGDFDYMELAGKVGIELEKRIVRVALGTT